MNFKIYTLGCKVNAYESNVMIDTLENNGYKQIDIDDNSNCDVVIINTCSVTNTADKKSVKTVRHAIKNNKDAIIVVTGCSSQNKKDVFLNIEGVDLVLGNTKKSKIVELINDYKNHKDNIEDISNVPFEPMILNNFNQTRAYVKIEDGCNNFCSYCVIPYVRGNVRSKEKNTVIEEVKNLINSGHKEVVLTGIHTGHYGADINENFADLLKELVEIKGLERLRISSIEITELNSKVLEVLKNSQILCDHIHIPLQSGSDNTLKQMNRKYDKTYFIDKINKIRSIRPLISITTDVIVGFPGETDDEFEECMETIKKVNFSKVHVFPYSKRDGTKAALMDNQIDDNIKKERVKKLLKLSEELEINYFNKFIGKEVIFIPEVCKDEYIIGHTGNYLQVKTKGCQKDLDEDIKVKIETLEYPYVIGKR